MSHTLVSRVSGALLLKVICPNSLLPLSVTVAVLVQPAILVPVTVYVVVVTGLTVTLSQVVHDKPVDGDHEYVAAPVADRVYILLQADDELACTALPCSWIPLRMRTAPWPLMRTRRR